MRRNKPWIDTSPFGDYDPSDDDPDLKEKLVDNFVSTKNREPIEQSEQTENSENYA